MILVGGGSRSGKSTAALRMLRDAGPRKAFIATAQVFDEEMRARVDAHRAERDADIETFEEPLDVAALIDRLDGDYNAVVLDCLTLWLSNVMLAGDRDVEAECRRLIDSARNATMTVILVSNEVGCGIVPDNALARRFRDAAGKLNQLAAEHAKEVHWMMFGVGLRIK